MRSAICHNGNDWWWVRIHDTQPDMLATANALHVRRGGERDHNPPDTMACFQPSGFWYHVDDDGDMTPARKNGYTGTMRLVQGNINSEIVAHECVHLALRTYRGRHDDQATLGTDCGPNEESLAYIIGQTVRTMTDALYELGVWT